MVINSTQLLVIESVFQIKVNMVYLMPLTIHELKFKLHTSYFNHGRVYEAHNMN